MRNEELSDMLTELDPPYESKEELKIGRMLDQYGIPFFYNQPTVIYNEGQNEIHKPSFTLFSFGGTVIDYVAGFGEEPRLQKEQLYHYNQIPAVLMGSKDLEKPNWDKDLYQKLEQVYRQTFDPARYTPVGAGQVRNYS